MEEYWKRHSSRPSLEAMFLDRNAPNFVDLDTNEVLQFIPDYENKNVVELAAGIGRFTTFLAKKANHLTVVEFMDSFLDKNKITNGHFSNVDFICADVCNFDMPSNSVDIVFSNWLLMYLSDEEIEIFSQKVLKWLNPGGCLIFRESCFGRGGDDREGPNPTYYRTSEQYTRIFNTAISSDVENVLSKYELIKCKNMETYVKVKGNKGQIAWVWQKTLRQGSVDELKYFLDNNQYSRHSILRYERIFGTAFVSTGGLETTRELVQKLDLQPGSEVLDVGCGIGGSAFYMATQYGVQVWGIDLSVNMLNIAFEYAHQQPRESRIILEYSDATTKQFSPNQFDVIYSRDTILHIKDKLQLFRNFHTFLKPGNHIYIYIL
jgi:phosphoethanolamine N-methyltransferase